MAKNQAKKLTKTDAIPAPPMKGTPKGSAKGAKKGK